MTTDLLESIPIGIIWQSRSPSGERTIHANPAAQRLLELGTATLSVGELSQLPLYIDPQLSPLESSKPIHPNPLKAGLLGQPIDRRDVVFMQRPLHLRTFTPKHASGLHALCIQPRDHRLFCDHNNAKTDAATTNAEVAMRQLGRFNQLLSEVATSLNQAQRAELDAVINHALQQFGRYLCADRCYVFLFDPNRQRMRNTHEWVEQGVTAHIDELQDVGAEQLPWFFPLMRNYGVMSVNALSQLPTEAEAEYRLFTDEGIRSLACVGFTHNGQLRGFVGCDMVQHEVQWNEAELRRLRLFANLIGNAINTRELLDELEALRTEKTPQGSQSTAPKGAS